MARANIAGLLAIALWSSLATLTVFSGNMPPFQLAACTFAIGGSLGFGVAIWRRDIGSLRQPWQVWLLGVGGLFGYHALYFSALRHAPAAEAGLIAYLWPLLIVLLSCLEPGGRFGGRHLFGAVLGFTGAVTMLVGARTANGEGVALQQRYLPGFSLALAAAFVWSSYSIISRRFRDVPTTAVTGFCLGTAVLALLCHLIFETTVWPGELSSWLAIFALGLGPVGAAFFAWDVGVKHGDIGFLGVSSYAAPAISTFLLVLTGVATANSSLVMATVMIAAAALVAAPRT